jgi:adenosylmethionine-8-amino-7-oxononanoate aminotransferase
MGKSQTTSSNRNLTNKLDDRILYPGEYLEYRGEDSRTFIDKSKGIYLYDKTGHKMIDGPGGMWNVNVGHGVKEIADAVHEQIRKMPFASPFSESTEIATNYASRLVNYAPGDLKRVFFTSGGSSAVDSALRFVMFYNNVKGLKEKKLIISRHDAYHGSTYLSASCSGKERDKNNFDFADDIVHHLSSPNPFRKDKQLSDEEFCDLKVKELEDKILELGSDKVAAFIAEPILASGGVIVPPKGYHKKTLEICRKHNVIYISDEIVTGFGRLGHIMSTEEYFDVTPDIILLAKGITSGYVPCGAVVISETLMADLDNKEKVIFSNGFTDSGHPVAMAAAHATLDFMENNKLLDHVKKVAPYFQSKLSELIDLPIVGDVRGAGLMAAVECVIDKEKRDPLNLQYEIASRINTHCQNLGLIVRPLFNTCVMSPSLIIEEGEIDELVRILREGIMLATEDIKKEGLWS